MNNSYPNQGPYFNNAVGYNYGTARPQARNTQPLTAEQINKLRQNSSAFDMKVTDDDLLIAACTHKEKSGASTLIKNDDGTHTCTICHETFEMCENTKEEIEEAVAKLINMLQTCKTIYLDAPEKLVEQYFQQIPLLKKFPYLWDRAMKNFAMYDVSTSVNPMSNGYGNGFHALNMLMSNPYAAYPQYSQQPQPGAYAPQPAPVYAQPQPQPMYDQYGNMVQQPGAYAPQPAPVYAQPQPQVAPQPMYDQYGRVVEYANPVAYNMGEQPQYAAPQPAPAVGAVPGAPQPAPATQQGEVHQTQSFKA